MAQFMYTCAPDCRQCVQDTLTAEWDLLDSIRQNAHEEFARNGVEVEMGPLEGNQFRKSIPAIPTTSVEVTHGRDSARSMEYLEMRKTYLTCWCAFCKKNGETTEWWASHQLRDYSGRVTCPVLRRYVCPRCGATGDVAHTIRYCPYTKKDGQLEPWTVAELKTAGRLSNGRRRATRDSCMVLNKTASWC